jgi:hypothetical protein
MNAFILAVLLSTASWADHYQRGVALVQEGKAQQGRAELEQALAARPAAALHVRSGERTFDYLPQLYLALACQMSGDLALAREYLAAAEKDGKAGRSATGRPLLEAYRVLLATPAAVSAAGTTTNEPRYRVFQRKPVVLSEERHRQLQSTVLSRCQLRPDSDAAQAPWYYHYEMGLRLLAEGDAQRALDALIDAVTRRSEPQREARIYGMWFTDYRPFFHIARAHVRLQNWECARDALALSAKASEVTARDREFAEFRMLLDETGKNAAP